MTTAACNAKPASYTLSDLISELSATEVHVEQRPQLGRSTTFFETPGSVLVVDGHQVWVYEYDDVTSREAISETILMGGWSVNHTPVEWIASPHYWLRGRLIVQYLGDDAAPIGVLSGVLGEEFRPPQ